MESVILFQLYDSRWYLLFLMLIDQSELLVENRSYWLQFKLFEHTTRFPFTYSSAPNCPLNKLRTHHFFSLSKDINSTLEALAIDIRITEGEQWEHAVFAGKSMSLREFASDFCSFEIILLPRSVSLFSGDVNSHVTLQAIIGLTCDGEIDVSLLNLYRGMNVYYTNDSYYSSYPFPSEWIELFNGQNKSAKGDLVDEDVSYAPVISPREFIHIRERYKIQNKNRKAIAYKTLEKSKDTIANPYQLFAENSKKNASETKKIYRRRLTNYDLDTGKVKHELVSEIKTWMRPDKRLSIKDLTFSRNMTHDSFVKVYNRVYKRSSRWNEDHWSQSGISSMTISCPGKCNVSVRSDYYRGDYSTLSNIPVSYTHLTLPTKRIV
eukprot:TRINITY_DN7114_c0_g3_i12.p1 TRINITY_DN7114_c0_g3~~TRINITY_DN7114_c0_g3_i12.p1  ORF type:complete len:379 (+),score=45.16 TRINITY_DN7114_c0_g3_i12:1316-2452(+)